MKKIITTHDAPAPIGPYSQAVVANGMVFLSGQIAIDPQTNVLLSEDVARQTHQVMKNISAVLQASGTSMEHIVKSSIFLSNMNDFPSVNEVYGSYFKSDFPARETVEVSRLPKDVDVEISVIALIP